MSSLVLKQRQQVAVEKVKSQSNNNNNNMMTKGLSRRVSFEKLRVTALQFRLACTKCPREALKFWLEMILLRSRIITAAFNLLLANVVQLSHEWNSTLLQITTVVLPKWQIRAQHIVDTAILQRQRLRQQDVKSSSSSNNTRTSPADTQTKDAPQTGVVKPAVIEEETDDLQENLVPDVFKDAETELILETSRLTSEEQVVRQRLTIALTACVAFLALQIFLGVILLCTSVNGLPLGLVFQVACLAYIAYLLQSICDFTRMNVTNCNYGKASKVSRKVFNTTAVVAEASDGAVKVIQLSFEGEDNE